MRNKVAASPQWAGAHQLVGSQWPTCSCHPRDSAAAQKFNKIKKVILHFSKNTLRKSLNSAFPHQTFTFLKISFSVFIYCISKVKSGLKHFHKSQYICYVIIPHFITIIRSWGCPEVHVISNRCPSVYIVNAEKCKIDWLLLPFVIIWHC